MRARTASAAGLATTLLLGGAGNDNIAGGPGTDDCRGGPGRNTISTCENGGGTPNPPDLPPVATADSRTVAEDDAAQTIDVLANDTDPDGGAAKSVASVTQPLNGTVVIAGGGSALTYRPNPNYCNSPGLVSTDDFGYTLAPGGSAASVAVTVTCVNDAPVVSTTASPLIYSQGVGPLPLDPGVGVADIDSASLAGATVAITGNYNSAQDELFFGDQLGITGTYDSGTGVLTLTGSASVADYQAALRSVRFQSTNSNPPDSKAVEFRANDGTADSAAATRNITIAGPNTAPAIGTGGTLNYAENDPATPVDSGLTVADAEANSLTGASASINSGYQSGEDALGWVDNDGTDNIVIDAGSSTAQTIVLTGTGSDANYQAALRAVTYVNSSETPSTAAREVTFSATDEINFTGMGTRMIAVSAVDDPPVAVNDSATVLEDASATSIDVLANDTDVDAGPKTIASATAPANGTVVLTGGSPGEHTGLTYQPDGDYCNDPPGTSPDAFNYTLNGGSSATVSVTVTCENDAPVADDETFNGANRAVGNTSLVVNDPDDGAPDPAGPQKTVSGDILSGDDDIDGPGPLAVEPETKATSDGGSVTIEADGDFSFSPAAGTSCTDTTDQFDYTVKDGHPTSEQSDVGTVTIEIADCVWYVDDSAPGGGDGRSHSPLNALDNLDGAGGAGDADGTGQHIFLYDGSYTGGLPLENGQRLFTEKHGLTVPDGGAGNVTLEPADGSGSGLQGGLVLASGNSVQGLDLGTTGSSSVFALSGSSVGSANVNNLTSGDLNNPAGGAVNIDGTGNTLNIGFGTLTSTGSSSNAIRLVNSSGSFSGSSGTISNAGTADVNLNGGSLNFTLGSTIADDAGQLVVIQNKTGGTNDFNGQLTDSPFVNNNGGGISLQSNTGTTRFDGGVNLSTGPNPGIAATNGGTLAIPDPAGAPTNFVDSTTGTALNLASTDIHSDDLVFERISSNGATSAIVLNTTGSAGGLTVTGNGAANSGGVIQSSTGAGINLTSVGGGVDLTRMSVGSGGDDGIRATTVNGFGLHNSSVTSNGNAAAENGLDFTDVTGTVTLASDTVSNNRQNNVSISNGSGTLNATVNGGTYSGAVIDDGIFVEGTNTGAQNLTVQGPITFANNAGDHVQHGSDASNTTDSDVTITGATMSEPVGGGTSLAGGITVSHGGSSNVDASITNNNIQNSVIGAIAVGTTGSALDPQSADVDVTISGNTIGATGVAGSGSTQGNGIFVDSNGAGHVRALITNNNVRQWTNRNGLHLDVIDGPAVMDVTVRNNVFTEPNSAFAGTTTRGMTLQLGTGQAADTIDACLDIGHASDNALKNQVFGTGESPQPDIRYLHEGPNSQVQLAGYGGGASPTITDIANYLQPRNNLTGTPSVTGIATAAGATTANIASCPLPAP